MRQHIFKATWRGQMIKHHYQDSESLHHVYKLQSFFASAIKTSLTLTVLQKEPILHIGKVHINSIYLIKYNTKSKKQTECKTIEGNGEFRIINASYTPARGFERSDPYRRADPIICFKQESVRYRLLFFRTTLLLSAAIILYNNNKPKHKI